MWRKTARIIADRSMMGSVLEGFRVLTRAALEAAADARGPSLRGREDGQQWLAKKGVLGRSHIRTFGETVLGLLMLGVG